METKRRLDWWIDGFRNARGCDVARPRMLSGLRVQAPSRYLRLSSKLAARRRPNWQAGRLPYGGRVFVAKFACVGFEVCNETESEAVAVAKSAFLLANIRVETLKC
jgi:hypothetical protein